uniref:Uncharacterized protein n=1 Tax=Theileria annulata TaxID=5874 RepID=A0A3B0NL52_THEAN
MSRKSKNKALESLIHDFDKCLSELLVCKDRLIAVGSERSFRRSIVKTNLIFQRNKTKYSEICRENDRLESLVASAELEFKEKLVTRNNLSAKEEEQRRITKTFFEAINQKNCLINNLILHIEEYEIVFLLKYNRFQILRKKSAILLSMLNDLEKTQDDKNSDIEKLKRLVNSLKNELDSNLNVLEQNKEEIKLLDNEIAELEKSNTNISNELFEIDSMIELNENELNSLEERINDKNIECDQIKGEIYSIESKINSQILSVKERQMTNEEIRNKIKSVMEMIKSLNDSINHIANEITINSGFINRRNERIKNITIKIDWFIYKSDEITNKIRNLRSLSNELSDHKYKQEGLVEESHRLDSEFYKMSIIENNLLVVLSLLINMYQNEIDKIKAKIEDLMNERSTNNEILGDKSKMLEKITEEEELLNQELSDLKGKLAEISEKKESFRNNEKKRYLKKKFERELTREFEKVSVELEEKTNKILQSMNQNSDSEIKVFENKMELRLKNTRNDHEIIILEKRNVIESLEKELNSLETIENNK